MTDEIRSSQVIAPSHDLNAREKSIKVTYFSGTVADKMLFGKKVVTGLNTNPTVIRIMQPLGYDRAKVAAMTAKYEEVCAANVLQIEKLGDKKGYYADYEKLFSIAKKELHYFCKVAKIAFKNDTNEIDKLKLTRIKGKSIADIFLYMENIYSVVLHNISMIEALAAFSYSEVKIRDLQAGFKKAQAAYLLYGEENADSIEATRVRDEKLAEFDEWMFDYYTLEKIGYAQNPDWLEEQEAQDDPV